MGVLIPRGIRRNPVSTAVWLASKRRNEKRNEYIYGPTPPFGSLAYYAFNQVNLEIVTQELVNKQLTLYSERASNSNITQSSNGSIVTYGENEPAFDVGASLVTQGEATNLYPYSQDFTQWSLSATGLGVTPILTPSFADSPAGAGTGTRVQLDIDGGTSSADKSAVTDVVTTTVGFEYVHTLFMKTNDGSTVDVTLITASIGAASSNVTVTPEWQRLEVQLQSSGGSSFGVQLRGDVGSAKSADIIIAQGDVTNSTTASSPIYTNGMSATRAPDNNQAATLLKAGAWIDDRSNCVLADRNTPGIVDGVSASVLSFSNGTTTDGKYVNLITAQFDNALGRSKDGLVEVILTSLGGSNCTWVMHRNDTGLSDEDAVRSRFGNTGDSSNPFTIDFIPSDYNTGNFAADTIAVEGVRTAAGDLNIPAAEQWPVNDYRLVLNVELLQLASTAGNWATIAESYIDASNRVSVLQYNFDPTRFLVQSVLSGAVESVDTFLPTVPEISDNVVIDFEKSSTLGNTITVRNLTKGESSTDNFPSQLNNSIWGNFMDFGYSGGAFQRLDIAAKTLTLRPL